MKSIETKQSVFTLFYVPSAWPYQQFTLYPVFSNVKVIMSQSFFLFSVYLDHGEKSFDPPISCRIGYEDQTVCPSLCNQSLNLIFQDSFLPDLLKNLLTHIHMRREYQ